MAVIICKGWTMFYNLLPELFILILIMITTGFLRSSYEIRIMLI